MSSLEGLLETIVETALSEGSGSLLLAAGLGSLGLEGGGASSLAGSKGLLLGGSEGLGGRVDSLHEGSVLERVLLALGGDISVLLLHAELGLDLIGVDDSGEVSARHHVSSELEAALGSGLLSVGAEDAVELGEGVLGEDDESSEVTTRGELEEIESGDVAGVDTGEVPGGALHGRVLVTVDDQGSLGADEAGVAHLTLAGSGSPGVADAGEVTTDTDHVEALEESGSLLVVEAVDDKRELGNRVDVVASGHNERTASGGSEGRGDSVSLLVNVDLSLPLSPDLERGEHAALTAHVTEGTLAGAVSTRARDSWDSGNSASGTPRLSGVLVAGVPVDGVTLSSVLGHVGVAELNEIISDRGSEDSGHVGRAGNLVGVVGVNADGGTGSHLNVFFFVSK